MATREKIKKKKPKSTAQVIPLEDKSPPVLVSGAEDENIVDTTFKEGKGKAAPAKYKKGQKTEKSKEKHEKESKVTDEKNDSQKEKGSHETDNDSSKERPSSRQGTPTPSFGSRPVSPESRPGTPSSITSTKARRSPSPFGRNVVEPMPGGHNSNMGSMLSIKSSSSVKEAWTDDSEGGAPLKTKPKPSSAKSTSTVISTIDKNGRQKGEGNHGGSTVSVRSKLEAEGPEQNAYIPYLYAKNSIAGIMNDMQNMKTNHIRIVHDIGTHYKAIEDETQKQFNAFVLCLRENYSGKVQTFRQVIDIHRLELTKKEAYWNELLRSLTERNNRLLKDKKVLLVKSKVEIDRLEKEKTEVTTHFTQMLDKANASASTAEKNWEDQITELKTEKGVLLTDMENLKKQLTEQEETSSPIVPVTAAVVTAAAVGGAAGTKGTGVQTTVAQTQTDGESKQTVGGTAVVTVSVDKGQQKLEQAHISEERQEMTDERKKMDEERDRQDGERKGWLEDIQKLQTQLTQTSMERAEWEGKYDLLKQQAQDAATIHKKYAILESQYAALSAVVAATQESKTAAEENCKQSKEEKNMMAAEKARLEADIQKFEAEYKKKNGRMPSQEDKSDSDKEMYTQLEEVNTMVTSLDKKIETLENIQSGTVLPPPEVAPVPVVINDPEVTTIEVKVPDPSTVEALEKAQQELSALETQLSDLRQEKSELHESVSSLNSDLSESKGKVTDLERLLAESSQNVGVGMGAVAAVADNAQSEEKVAELTSQLADNNDELERLRKENREMQKDMKKMIKRYEKVQARMKSLEEHEKASALLQVIVAMAHEVHETVPAAGSEVDRRLESEEEELKKTKDSENQRRKDVDAWVQKYKKKNKKEPTQDDRDGEAKKLYEALSDSAKDAEDTGRRLEALKMLKTGVVKMTEMKQQRPTSAARLENAKEQEMDEKVIDLESENEALKEDKDQLEGIKKELEQQLRLLEEQVAQQTAQPASGQPVEDMSEELSSLQKEIDTLNASLREERTAHDKTREELEQAQNQMSGMNEEMAGEKADVDAQIDKVKKVLEAKLNSAEEEAASLKQRNEQLEAERLAKVPVDTAKEIKNLQNKIALLEKDKRGSGTTQATMEAQLSALETKLKLANKNLETQRATNRDIEGKVKAARTEKDQSVKELTNQLEKKELQCANLEKKVKQLEARVPAKQAAGAAASVTAGRHAPADKGSKDQLVSLKRENTELSARVKHLEQEGRRGGTGGDAGADKNLIKRHEKILKELEKKYEMEKAKNEKLSTGLKAQEEETKELTKTCGKQETELKKLRDELAALGVAAKEGVEAAVKVKTMEKDMKRIAEENKVLTENFNSERVLRKKYYNMVEDMKGKIRVYCRARPLSNSEKQRGNHSVLKSPDEYSIEVASNRGLKEFQFDQIFMETSSQEQVFEDTNNLIQSAFDGYNVCIFAYGQTGSGKTFTMIGDRDQNFPGIAPRAFNRIFDLAGENKSKMSVKVSTYMMELYNEKLIDLFGRPGQDDDRLEIKKDKKGMVFINGAIVKEASNSKELFALFEEGSKNRHTASTKMNDESSRSHLVIGIVMESTNLLTGQVLKGKLSLVDLAGSERVGKTGATAEQLKEAMSINKSLSALGDVISALSSEQSFIPYRNNKLTMLMQDSLGGNAKTLMFVNISPADYNTDETVISLTYASRVKLITNDASKNADNKEIVRLKALIQKMKKGESVDDDD